MFGNGFTKCWNRSSRFLTGQPGFFTCESARRVLTQLVLLDKNSLPGLSDNIGMDREGDRPSLGKLFLLALVSTRGTKLRYWKQILQRFAGSR